MKTEIDRAKERQFIHTDGSPMRYAMDSGDQRREAVARIAERRYDRGGETPAIRYLNGFLRDNEGTLTKGFKDFVHALIEGYALAV